MRKTFLLAGAFAVIFALTAFAGCSLSPESSVVVLESDTPCPAVGCASGQCHDYASVPVPDGVHEMNCPEASCSSVDCHAWDTLSSGYRHASNASLNAWILAPVALVVALVAMVGLLSRKKPAPDAPRAPRDAASGSRDAAFGSKEERLSFESDCERGR